MSQRSLPVLLALSLAVTLLAWQPLPPSEHVRVDPVPRLRTTSTKLLSRPGEEESHLLQHQEALASSTPVAGSIQGRIVSLPGRPDRGGVTVAAGGLASITATTGPDGAYILADVPEGSYTITLSYPSTLFTRKSGVAVVASQTTVLTDAVIYPGDLKVDSNQRVDLFDVILLGANWNKTAPTAWSGPISVSNGAGAGGAALSGRVSPLQGRAAADGAQVCLGAFVRSATEESCTGSRASTIGDGTYQVTGLPSGSVTVTAFAPGYLFAQRADVLLTAGMTVTLPAVTLPAGDIRIDGANRVDIFDLILLGSNWHRTAPTSWEVPPPTPTRTPTSTPTPTPIPPTPTPTSVPMPLGFGYGMQLDPGTGYPQAVSLVKDAGFGWAKAQIRWADLEPVQGQINWGPTDDIVNGAVNVLGLRRILLTVVAAPSWARPPCDHTDCNVNGPPSDPQTYASFVGKLVARHKGKIGAVEIWNEENLWYEWGGQGYRLSASQYVSLLRPAYAAIRAEDPNIVVVSGAPTSTGVNDGNLAIDDVLYIREMYDAGAKGFFDALGGHPGGYNNPPDDDPGHISTDTTTYKGDWSFYFRRFEQYRQAMLDYGDGGRQIWFTEFGWASAQGTPPPSDYAYALDNDEQEQAAYLTRALQIGKERGYVGLMTIWNLNFAPGADPNDTLAKRAFSIIHTDWTPRPAYSAVQAMAK